MPANPIAYDASAAAVFHPETRAPLAMDASWPLDAVAGEFCRLAYVRFENGQAHKDIVARAVGQVGYGNVGFFHDAPGADPRWDAQGFVAIDDQRHAIMAFRGTQPDSVLDILADLSIGLAGWTGPGRVHAGFRWALESIRGQLDSWLAAHAPHHLTIAGHSLGAALATLLAAQMGNAELVTFGSPLVGDAAFVTAMAGRGMRNYVDCADIVPNLPPAFLGYAHIGELRYIDAQGTVHRQEDLPALGQDQARAIEDYAPLRTLGNAPSRRIADHAPINYISAILGRRVGP